MSFITSLLTALGNKRECKRESDGRERCEPCHAELESKRAEHGRRFDRRSEPEIPVLDCSSTAKTKTLRFVCISDTHKEHRTLQIPDGTTPPHPPPPHASLSPFPQNAHAALSLSLSLTLSLDTALLSPSLPPSLSPSLSLTLYMHRCDACAAQQTYSTYILLFHAISLFLQEIS